VHAAAAAKAVQAVQRHRARRRARRGRRGHRRAARAAVRVAAREEGWRALRLEQRGGGRLLRALLRGLHRIRLRP
jgi:hypothetical protein